MLINCKNYEGVYVYFYVLVLRAYIPEYPVPHNYALVSFGDEFIKSLNHNAHANISFSKYVELCAQFCQPFKAIPTPYDAFRLMWGGSKGFPTPGAITRVIIPPVPNQYGKQALMHQLAREGQFYHVAKKWNPETMKPALR